MTNTSSLRGLASKYHGSLPSRIRAYLNARGIPDELVDYYGLGFDGRRITIPITNRDGEVAFFKLARDPEDSSDGPKMMASEGSHVELYGWERILAKPDRIVICEGEFDRLVLEAQRIPAVTSTGGAGVFRREWAKDLERIPEVYVCFDRDEAGRAGALRVARMIPQARIVELPEEVGDGGDVTDFFVRLGKSNDEFLNLLAEAKPAPPAPKILYRRSRALTNDPDRERIERLKDAVAIEDVIATQVELRPSGQVLLGRCPFHEDRTPSFAVYPDARHFYCFGCGKRGDVITFLRELEGLSFPEALDALERLTGNHGPKTQPENPTAEGTGDPGGVGTS
jgi:DNA primase